MAENSSIFQPIFPDGTQTNYDNERLAVEVQDKRIDDAGITRTKLTKDAANSQNRYSIDDIVERGEYALDNSGSLYSKTALNTKVVEDTNLLFQVTLSESKENTKIKTSRKNHQTNERGALNLIAMENNGKNSTVLLFNLAFKSIFCICSYIIFITCHYRSSRR